MYIQSPYNTQSFNRYSYVFNNPLSLVDPTGYFSDMMQWAMESSYQHTSGWFWNASHQAAQMQINYSQAKKVAERAANQGTPTVWMEELPRDEKEELQSTSKQKNGNGLGFDNAQEGSCWGSYGPLRTAICNTAMEGCTPQSVYSNGLKILPGPGGDGTPFENGAISELFVGPTQHFFNDDTLTVHNVALEGHVLSGVVTRQVVTDSRGWVYIETSKVGPATPLNVAARLVDGALWRDVDLRIRRMVYHHAVQQQ
ncbi:RHS repeat-associated core domain-containing protein [Cellvibrio japonicus]|uniref:Rhs family protein n=1 Tax=Cellvibrio japonicus (strain Ueda107) TaxID=498211 RepID=B3PFL8_CELJU|nr:Rhs family protein [Cellvibrio japonicus]ACE83227.1 Rhs family protein [Cellvibrio japonicus Ueda107]